MSDILKIYTADQLYNMYRLKIIADGAGLTDFNDGSKVKTLIQSNSDIISSISMDFKEALYRAIPVAMYEGLNFAAKSATNATGYLRPFRKPKMVITYSGAGTSAKITITSTGISGVCIGAPSDTFSLLFATYTTTTALAAAIDALTNWGCAAISSFSSASLYQYSGVEVIGAIDYTRSNGFDVMAVTDIDLVISTGYSVTLNTIEFQTVADATILAGTSGLSITSKSMSTGTSGNISAGAINTVAGKGAMNVSGIGIDGVINDTAFSGGSAAESEDARRIRFLASITALNAGTKRGIISALLTIDGIRSVGMRTSYPYRGVNTIILDDGSGVLSTSLIASASKILYGDPNDLNNYPGKNAEGIDYVFAVPSIISVSISMLVIRLSNINVDLDIIKSDVETAIQQYINTLPLGGDVVLSEIIRIAKNSNSSVYDCTISSPISNVVISGNGYARTGSGTSGTVTVTVSATGSL